MGRELVARDLARSNWSRENVMTSSQNILQCLHLSCTVNRSKIAILIQTTTQTIHAAAGPDRATQTVFSTTHHYFQRWKEYKNIVLK